MRRRIPALTSAFARPGLRLSLLYSEADGTNPAVNAVYRVLAICMFGIGLYEIRLPELDERSKVTVVHQFFFKLWCTSALTFSLQSTRCHSSQEP